MVPKNLTQEQKDDQINICSDIMERITEQLDVLENVITSGETWIFQYDAEMKKQLMHWKTPTSPRMKKVRMSKSKVKAMMIVFLDIRGVIMIRWVPESQTFNQKYYLEVLTKVQEQVRKKKSWILHQDNAPAHNALAVKQFSIVNKCIPMFDPSPIRWI
jgi:predicted nucleotidyltransferase